jgi:hypothetical protein
VLTNAGQTGVKYSDLKELWATTSVKFPIGLTYHSAYVYIGVLQCPIDFFIVHTWLNRRILSAYYASLLWYLSWLNRKQKEKKINIWWSLFFYFIVKILLCCTLIMNNTVDMNQSEKILFEFMYLFYSAFYCDTFQWFSWNYVSKLMYGDFIHLLHKPLLHDTKLVGQPHCVVYKTYQNIHQLWNLAA